MSADVEQEVARRGDGRMPRAYKLAERVQPGRTRLPEEAIPQSAPETGDAGQLTFRDAEADRSLQPTDIREKRANLFLAPGVNRDDEKERSLGERRHHGLRFRSFHDISLRPATHCGRAASCCHADASPRQ
jgi:hypothetical protein